MLLKIITTSYQSSQYLNNYPHALQLATQGAES